MAETDIAKLQTDLNQIGTLVHQVNNDLSCISNITELGLRLSIRDRANTFYKSFPESDFTKELKFHYQSAELSYYTGNFLDFCKHIFMQIEAIVNYGLFSVIGLQKINLDLQTLPFTRTVQNNKQETVPLVEHIFGWRNGKSQRDKRHIDIVDRVEQRIAITEKDIQIRERISLYHVYFLFPKGFKWPPDFNTTDILRIGRNKQSHSGAISHEEQTIIDNALLEYNAEYHKLLGKCFEHLKKFASGL